jgi:hypothetical protein
MARRPNYGVQKHQTELKKQKKRADKQEKKRLKEEAANGPAPSAPDLEVDRT